MAKLWSELSEKTRNEYKKQGVTPQRYNAFAKQTGTQKLRAKKYGLTKDKFLTMKESPQKFLDKKVDEKIHFKKIDQIVTSKAGKYIAGLRRKGKIPNEKTIYKNFSENKQFVSKIPDEFFQSVASGEMTFEDIEEKLNEKFGDRLDDADYEEPEDTTKVFWYH